MNRWTRLTQLVGLNSVPLLGVVRSQWSDGTALGIYYCENVMMVAIVAGLSYLYAKSTDWKNFGAEVAFVLLPAPFIFMVAVGAGGFDIRAMLTGVAYCAVFLLAGGCLIPQTPLLAAIFILIGLFCAFEAWIGWCAIRACGVKTPL